MSNRPAGITFLVILFIVLGVLSLLWSGLSFGIGGLSSLFGNLFGAESVASFGISTAWYGFLGLFSSIIQIIVAFGMASMKPWSWILAICGLVLTVAEGIIGIYTGGAMAFMCGTMGLIVPILVLIYLLSPSVRSLFLKTSG